MADWSMEILSVSSVNLSEPVFGEGGIDFAFNLEKSPVKSRGARGFRKSCF